MILDDAKIKDKEEAKRGALIYQLKNMTKQYTKQFALILKMLIKEDKRRRDNV